MHITLLAQPIVALVAGILILIMPQLLNYIVAVDATRSLYQSRRSGNMPFRALSIGHHSLAAEEAATGRRCRSQWPAIR